MIYEALFVEVYNNEPIPVLVSLFNTLLDPTDAKLPEGVIISVRGGTHVRLKTEIIERPIKVHGLIMAVTTSQQINNPLSIYYDDKAGNKGVNTFLPASRRSPEGKDAFYIEAPDFVLTLNGVWFIETMINGFETVRFIFLKQK